MGKTLKREWAAEKCKCKKGRDWPIPAFFQPITHHCRMRTVSGVPSQPSIKVV